MFTFSAPGIADELAAILRYGEDYYGRALDACMWSLMVDQAHLVCGYVGGMFSTKIASRSHNCVTAESKILLQLSRCSTLLAWAQPLKHA